MKYVNPKSSRRVTPFQYRVYDLVAQVPAGRVTSYKILSDVLKSSPRAVGQALRVNPFCPLPVPCHRVIAANYSIGGFAGGSGDHQFTADKRAKLQAEGCVFGEHYDFKHDKNGSTEFFDKFVF
ncbi:6-O-methylguanine DNA methyltransferase [Mycotypha africana]|uniref:6-O-methylguanine DNA methyltransferase n=1 Tax=Mycotypha africana TaxID=64632 RepID=UPI0023008410|nr:6-O-methylguanine DNA methyltransferase [Mycotypha africana]KAI8987963.1 6-O-methylguanine DNA methyltransferase [Mycotypha africana]